MKKIVGLMVTLMLFSNIVYADNWVTAQLVLGWGYGKEQYVNGVRYLTCDYKIPGTNIAFSITTTDFTCPFTVEYNMLTKDWRSK